jgi:hypothetical protein
MGRFPSTYLGGRLMEEALHSSFSHCCEKILEKIDFKKEGLILVHSFWGFSP